MFFAGVAAAIVLLWPVPMRTPADSRDYLHAAEAFARGHDDPAYLEWPPLYPMILAVGIDARILNAVCYGLTVWLTLRQVTRFRVALTIGMLSPVFLYIHLFMLSDAPFVLMTVLFLIELPRRRIVPLALILTAAIMLKYSGVFLIVFAVAYRLHTYGLKNALTAVPLPLTALLGWGLRNAALTGSLLGERAGQRYPVGESIAGTAVTLIQFGGVLCALVCLEILLSRLLSAMRSSLK